MRRSVIACACLLVAPAGAAAEPVEVSYDKGLLFRGDGFAARLALRTQVRLEVARPLEDGATTEARFVIPRARLQLEGHVHGEDTRYKLELGVGDRGSFSFVRDLYVDQGVGPVWLRAGQWKRPFNRQELVSDFGSELNERAITADLAGGGRDVGVAVHNDYERSPEGLEWVIGVFNRANGGADRPGLATTCEQDPLTGAITCTNATPTNAPVDFAPAVVARAGWNHGGIKGYSEGDLEGGPLRVAVGASYKVDFADPAALGHGAQVDALLKVHGFDLQLGGYLMKGAGDDARLGGFAQAGWFVTPRALQVAARFAIVELAGAAELVEARGALTWFVEGHAYKWVTDAGFLQELDGADEPDLQLRSMVQLTF